MVWMLTGSESSCTFLENIWTASERWGKGRWVRTWWTKSARVLYANGRNDSLVVQPLPIRTSSSNSWSMWGTNPVEEFEISAKCNGAIGKFTCLRPLLAHNNCCLTLCYQAAFCHVTPINNSRVKNKMSCPVFPERIRLSFVSIKPAYFFEDLWPEYVLQQSAVLFWGEQLPVGNSAADPAFLLPCSVNMCWPYLDKFWWCMPKMTVFWSALLQNQHTPPCWTWEIF